jgi:hypothetical protein
MKGTLRSRLVELASETTRKGYVGRAQQRASRRKSLWKPAGFIWPHLDRCRVVGITARCVAARNLVIPQHATPFSTAFRADRTGLAVIVSGLSPFFAAVPIGMVISNFTLWCIPPYRRACAREAKGVWHASFEDAQKDLSLMILCMSCPALVVFFIAALLIRV